MRGILKEESTEKGREGKTKQREEEVIKGAEEEKPKVAIDENRKRWEAEEKDLIER